jgi:hypothetical protein
MISPANAFIIIPTYWTWPSTQGQRSELSAYDHPTPLDRESTLPALLEDLTVQAAQRFRVLVLVGLAHPDLGPAVSDHVRALLDPFRSRLDLRLCDSTAIEHLYDALGPTEPKSELLHLGSYAGIRNLQLLVPDILGAEAVIALDDDERVEANYVERALAHLGEMAGENRVLGIAGPYLQPEGGMLLKEQPPSGNAFRDKARCINAAMLGLMKGGDRLVASPMALGGNMVFHRALFRNVCFDPGITRGEDIDYLINARLQGIQWWFDPKMTILHVPPRHLETPAYQRTREDVFRFIYEREKLRLHGEHAPEWLQPYPGAMLGRDLRAQALAALQYDATPELIQRLGTPEAIVAQAQEHAEKAARRYSDYVGAWRELTLALERDSAMRQSAATAFPRL